MAKAEWTVYYCGHGGMNYIEITDSSNNMCKKIVIDAGCTDDKSIKKTSRVNYLELCDRMWKQNMHVPLILCITHYDADHYNLFELMYKDIIANSGMIEQIYFGSLTKAHLDFTDPQSFVKQVLNLIPEKVSILGQVSEINPLFTVEGDIEFGILWNNLCPGFGVNDNTGAYYLKNSADRYAYIFTGDMTGNTFLALMDTFVSLETQIHDQLENIYTITTIPHHGSIDTLTAGDFITPANYNDMQPLKAAMSRLSLQEGDFILSSGINDKFYHPDFLTARAFLYISRKMSPFSGYCFTYLKKTVPGFERYIGHWHGLCLDRRGFYPTSYLKKYDDILPEAKSYKICDSRITMLGTRALKANDKHATSYHYDSSSISSDLPAEDEIFIMKDNQISFRQLFGTIGNMYYYNNLALRFDSLPIDNILLTDYTWDGINYEGTLDVSQSRLSVYSWLMSNVNVKGSFKDGVLDGESKELPLTWSFSPLPIKEKKTKLVFKNKKNQETLTSEINLVIEAAIGAKQDLAVSVIYKLLGEKCFTIIFQGEEGLQIADCAAVIPELLGCQIDFLKLLPPAFPFIPSVRLYTLDIYCRNDILSAGTNDIQIYRIGFCMGYQKPNEVCIQANGIKLENVRFNIFGNVCKGSITGFSACMNASLKLFEQSFTLCASYPSYLIEFYTSLGTAVPIAKIAEAYALTVPSWLLQASINFLYMSAMPDFSQFHLTMDIEKIFTAELTQKTKVEFINLSLNLVKTGKITAFDLGAAMVIKLNDKRIADFSVSGEFTTNSVIFKGYLAAGDTALAEFYNAITGRQLPSAFPQVEILSMSLETEYAEQFMIRNYYAGVKVSVTDPLIFGAAFEMQASIAGTPVTFVTTGSFIMGEYFTIHAQISLSDSNVQWKFSLLFAKVMIEIACESVPESCFKGIIKSDLTLKDAVSYMVSLMAADETYVSSADWKLLDTINLNGVEITYYFNKKEMKLTVSPNIILPFAKVERLSVIMGTDGIDFKMAGTFMDQTYTEEQPLTWDAKNPPQTTGSLLHINYMLFGDDIQVDLEGVTGIENAMEKLEELIPPDKDIPSPVINTKAGFIGGIDCQIADAVQVQLLYDEWLPFYGARFYLYGDKAGKLKGLDAQISYTRLQENAGVFSGRITPPESMKAMKFGGMTIGIGEISAMIYTNGNFYIDLGYPNERNFSRSFSFSYGLFEGKGGIYIKKGITGGLALPATGNGYFSPILAMGVGMRLSIGQSVKTGPLAASASLVMQGVFEGVYATYLPYTGQADTYYRVSAQVSFEGKLQGSVDFGIIGASVTICINTKTNLMIEAYKPVFADLTMYVEAAASVKIWFCRIQFHFSTSFHMHLEFDSGGRAPWSNVMTNYEAPLCDSLPQSLHLGMENVEKRSLAFKITVIYGMEAGSYNSVITGLMHKADYEILISQLSAVLVENNYLSHTDGEEFFKSGRFFTEIEWLYDFLNTYFIFELDFNEVTAQEDMVIMPLPECLKVTVTTNYVYGVSDHAVRNLHDYFLINDVYLTELQDYYADTIYVPQDAVTGRCASCNKSETISMQEQIFCDYFELMVKAIRTEKNSSLRNKKTWNPGSLSEEQNENIIGLTTRFMLGGKRGSIKEHHGIDDLERIAGLWKLSGSQIPLPYSEDVKNYEYTVEFGTQSPVWVRFAGGKEKLSYTIDKSKVEGQLPALLLPKSYCTSLPRHMPAFESVKANSVYVDKILPLKKLNAAYYQAGSSLRELVVYKTNAKSEPVYGVMIQLKIQKCRRTKAMYRILLSENISLLRSCMEAGNAADKISLLYLEKPEDHTYAIYESDKLYQLNNKRTDKSGVNFITIDESQKFGEMLWKSCIEEAENYLGFFEESPLQPLEDQTIYLAVHFSGKAYIKHCNFAYMQSMDESVELIPDSTAVRNTLAQGAVSIELKTNDSQLSESEKILADHYQNIAAEVKESASGKMSHETLAFIGVGKADEDKLYRLVIPYSRALDGSDADPYDFASREREVEINLFWVDLFGNRMDSGFSLRLKPKYLDNLIAVHTYPAIDLTYSIIQAEEEDKLRISFRFTGSSENLTITQEIREVWKNALCQLRQSDVTMRLFSDALTETKIMDKEKLTAFLKKCIDNDTLPQVLNYDFDLPNPADKAEIASMLTWIYVNRHSLHVYPDAPENVSMVKSRLCYETEMKAACDTVKKSILFAGEKSIYALMIRDVDFIRLHNFKYYTWLRLPKVTGNFKKGTQSIQLTSFDLQEVFELFKQDIQFIMSPHVLEAVTSREERESWLDKIYTLRQNTAKGMAARITPMFQHTDGDESDADMHTYVEALLLEALDRDIEEILFCNIKGTSHIRSESGRWNYLGDIDNNDDYPVEFPIDTQQVDGFGGISSESGIIDMSQAKFIIRYLHDTKKEEWFSPADRNKEFLEIPLESSDIIMLPKAGVPSAPIFIANEMEDKAWSWTFEVRPQISDVLYVIKSNAEKEDIVVEENSSIYTMYDYYEKSRSLQNKDQPEERDRLIEYLVQYAEAFLSFRDDPKRDIAVQKVSFVSSSSQEHWEKIRLLNPDSDISIQYMIQNKNWYDMEKTADGFLFHKEAMPETGMSIRFKMTLAHQREENVVYSLCMVREQKLSENTSLVKNSSFDQWSAKISF